MALAATTNIEVRTTGSDTNGGGFVTGGSGTDYSQQDAEQYFIDGVTNTGIVQVTTTQILIAGYTVSANDVNNLLQITGGTATAGFYHINSVNTGTNTYTLDRSAGTSTQTVVGRIGGGLATLGKAGGVPLVAGNNVWLKYHASNVYTSTSTSSNVVNGRFVGGVGSQTAPLLVAGYETTHGDATGNRPTIRWGVNATSLALISSTAQLVIQNLILDGNRANFTQTRGFSSGVSTTTVNCKFMGFSSSAMIYTGGTHTNEMCEITDCTTASAVGISTAAQEIIFGGCYFHDSAGAFINHNQAARLIVIGCIFDTNSGVHMALSSTADGPYLYNNIFYGSATDAITLGAETSMFAVNNIFENNGGYGIAFGASGAHDSVFMFNNAFYNNTSGKYDTAKILAQNVFAEVNNTTGTFFADAANADFTLNSTASQGALARAVGYPITFPGLAFTNYRDIGPTQHQDTGGGGTTVNIFNVME